MIDCADTCHHVNFKSFSNKYRCIDAPEIIAHQQHQDDSPELCFLTLLFHSALHCHHYTGVCGGCSEGCNRLHRTPEISQF